MWPVFLAHSANKIPFYEDMGHAVPTDLFQEGETRSSSPPERGMDRQMVLSKVQVAVRMVLGADVADEEPLIQAGLDSLGEHLILLFGRHSIAGRTNLMNS